MSGYQEDGTFQLTPKKAALWHRWTGCACHGMPWCTGGHDDEHLWSDHLSPRGWTRYPVPGHLGVLHLFHPDFLDPTTGERGLPHATVHAEGSLLNAHLTLLPGHAPFDWETYRAQRRRR